MEPQSQTQDRSSTGSGPVPLKERRAWRAVTNTIGLVVTLALLFFLWQMVDSGVRALRAQQRYDEGSRFLMLHGREFAEAWLQLIREHRLDTAYAQTTPEFRQRLTPAAFTQLIDSHPCLRQPLENAGWGTKGGSFYSGLQGFKWRVTVVPARLEYRCQSQATKQEPSRSVVATVVKNQRPEVDDLSIQ